ncbi:CRISPR-associated helicase Cas3' [uncultured Ruminococcus sp.]|uniref:CRISPR-associated helicase Cas3' n=1 Tax=uncultured Ruminococcus sp. TaxID=165186 RepID=UPI0026703B15|nr:CRISPR-associated helicase Cas3' [uncultured Ruminococcus sp.]
MMEIAAHIRETDGREQSVAEHAKGVATLAERYGAVVSLGNFGKLLGLFHDAGKLNADFNRYIHGVGNFRRGEIDHCYAGAKYLCTFSDENFPKRKNPSRLAARVILSHHGLHDWLTEEGEDYFTRRTGKTERYGEISENLPDMLAELGNTTESLKDLMQCVIAEYTAVVEKIKAILSPKGQDGKPDSHAFETKCFYFGMLERLLESVLMDADRVDTADFMHNCQTEQHFDTEPLWEQMAQNLEKKLAQFADRTDPVSKQRQDISERCFRFADRAAEPVGACRLIVPTGGGKTLSSLRFAIHECRKFKMEKIVYVAPFMSILEQNSKDIREIAGAENFLEHHSNVLAQKKSAEELQAYELRTEKWDVPVLATTMVQFLQALFDGKNTSVRRMHRLCRSVIILDEVQSIPMKCTHLLNLAVNFLTKICGCTVVLCSATQPLLENSEYPMLLDENSSMTGAYQKDFEVLRRTELIPVSGTFSYDAAAEFCWEKFLEHQSLLVVVNTKASAQELFRRLQVEQEQSGQTMQLIHLSTHMCPAHRNKVIEQMRKALKQHRPILCVTTQLIEAGVDVSFGCVVRSMAGLSNAAQAAGRCNRNGELKQLAPVYLLELSEEKLGSLAEISLAQSVTRTILDSGNFADLLSVEAMFAYFRKLHHDFEKDHKLSYPVGKHGEVTLLELLSTDRSRVRKPYPCSKYALQAFATAGAAFQVIDDTAETVIVPYDDSAEEMILRLNGDISFAEMQQLLRQVQQYTISVYAGERKKLEESGGLYPLRCGALALEKRFYDTAALGLQIEGGTHEFLGL